MCLCVDLGVLLVPHVGSEELVASSDTDRGIDGGQSVVLWGDHETPSRPDGACDHESALLGHRDLISGSEVVCKGSSRDT